MHVEQFVFPHNGALGVQIVCENAYSPWMLTPTQAKELHEQLGAVLWEAGEIDELIVQYATDREEGPVIDRVRCAKCGAEGCSDGVLYCAACYGTDHRCWISVEERLPERDDGFVLMYIDFHEPHTQAAIRLGWYDESSECWRTQMGRLREHWEVTHWMVLPAAPEVSI